MSCVVRNRRTQRFLYILYLLVCEVTYSWAADVYMSVCWDELQC
jgi:hypothetical protein